MTSGDKPLVWLEGEIKLHRSRKEPDWRRGISVEGWQQGEPLPMPHSRPLPSIGPRCHELRINDEQTTWRIVYRIDSDAIVILEVFSKNSRAMPKAIIEAVKRRLKDYDHA